MFLRARVHAVRGLVGATRSGHVKSKEGRIRDGHTEMYQSRNSSGACLCGEWSHRIGTERREGSPEPSRRELNRATASRSMICYGRHVLDDILMSNYAATNVPRSMMHAQ